MRSKAFLIPALSVFILFVATNFYSYTQMDYRVVYIDGFASFGVPWTLYSYGGYATVSQILWGNLVADLTVALMASIVAGIIGNIIFTKLRMRSAMAKI